MLTDIFITTKLTVDETGTVQSCSIVSVSPLAETPDEPLINDNPSQVLGVGEA